jgi:hypothetical protein
LDVSDEFILIYMKGMERREAGNDALGLPCAMCHVPCQSERRWFRLLTLLVAQRSGLAIVTPLCEA